MAGQMWSPDALGGYLTNNTLSRQIRKAASSILKFRQFVRPEPGSGAKKGDIVKIDRVSRVQTAGGVLAENSRIPETNIVIDQIQITMNEYGNSIPYTGKLEMLAEFSADNLITAALRDDEAEVLDAAAAAQFQAAAIKYTPTGTDAAPTGTFDTDGTVSTAATRDVQAWDIETLVNYLFDTLKAPFYEDGKYICICTHTFMQALLRDEVIRTDLRYGQPQAPINGYFGDWGRVRFVEENKVLDTSIGSTSYVGEAIIFGEDPVVEAIALPAEIRAKIPEDYGRSKGIAWYALLGFKIVWESATAREAKIIHVTST